MKKIFLLGLLIFLLQGAFASHLRCGYITVERSSCTANMVIITITVFTNTYSAVQFGGDGILSFGDGEIFKLPEIENTYRPDLGPSIGIAQFTRTHTYTVAGEYIISYLEPNRNGGVLNMHDSFNTTFYTETKIDLTKTICASPVFLAPPVFTGITDSQLNVSLGTSSQDDNLITYEMAVPFRDRGLPVTNFVKPPNMSLNKLTGLLTWDAYTALPGEYNFAVIAIQWSKVGENYYRIGFVRIDFQVILKGDVSEIPTLTDNQTLDEYNRILVKPGEEKQIEFSYISGNNNTAQLEIYSELNEPSISFSTIDVGGPTGNTKTGLLTITPQESDVRENGYLITVRGRTAGTVYDRNYLIYTDEIPEFPIAVLTGTEKEIAHVEIFPNPVQHQVNIQVNRAGISEVLIYSVQGRLVTNRFFEGNTTVTLSELPPGVYIIDVQRNNTSVRKVKLIKTK